jgi:hypothetical protein
MIGLQFSFRIMTAFGRAVTFGVKWVSEIYRETEQSSTKLCSDEVCFLVTNCQGCGIRKKGEWSFILPWYQQI